VQEITLRLDKGFFSREMVAALEALGVSYVLKVPDQAWVRSQLSAYRNSSKDEAIWSASGTLYGARLLCIQQRKATSAQDEELALGSAWACVSGLWGSRVGRKRHTKLCLPLRIGQYALPL
jgi:hypothetical protein